MLTKLRYGAGEGKSTTTEVSNDGNSGKNLQIIGMSATMPNASAVASWLQVIF
jgi:replicative superfamily II helicase